MTRLVINLQTQGQGPWVVLSHALGCNLSMYDELAADLSCDHHVLSYDHRGHGGSQGSDADFGIGDLADDLADLIQRKCQGEPVVVVGVSMGGMAAQALAARQPPWLRGIVVANSAQHYDDDARSLWQARMALVHAQGLGAVADGAMQRWFSPAFRQNQPGRVAGARRVLEACDARAYVQACQAVMLLDTRASNRGIVCPALVIDGQFDDATPAVMSDAIASHIPNSSRASLPTGHLSATEDPAGFAHLVRGFLAGL